jgi:hypothetical protein
MPQELRAFNTARRQWLNDYSSAWAGRKEIFDPSLWLQREPDIEEKMLRDADIAHAVGYRKSLIAGRQWNLMPRDDKSEMRKVAVSVGTELLEAIEGFTGSRKSLARAFFSGQRFSLIHGEMRTLTLGDGRPRRWWVPTRLEDRDKRMYRIMADNDGETLRANWEEWNVASREWETLTKADAAYLIKHTYEDDQSSLGYGRALREALGWWWYAKAEVFQESLKAVEKYAGGTIVARIDGLRDAETGLPNAEVMNEWADTLEDHRARHTLVYDKADEVEIIEPGGQGWQMLTDMRDDLKNTIFTLVLGANLTTAANDGGSFALAEVQENSTEALIQFDREVLEETLTKDLLGCIWFKNHANMVELGISNEKPRFAITQEKRQDPMQRAQVAQTLNSIGVDIAADDLYEQTGFKKPEPGEDIIEGGSAQPAIPGFGFKGA